MPPAPLLLQMYRMMVHWTLLLLPLLCVGATALKKIVHRIDTEMDWFGAQAYCRLHHIDLLTIMNQAENEQIINDGWIGLYRDYGSIYWKWSSGHVNDFWMWLTASFVYGERCGIIKADANGWTSRDCSDTYPSYCEDEPLLLVKQKKPWEEALEHCRNLIQHHPTVYENHRYDLASPFTSDDTVYAQDIFQQNFNKVWLGLRYLGDQWRWLSGQYYDDYLHCPVINRCGTLENNVTITVKRRNCFLQLYFLCARKSDV